MVGPSRRGDGAEVAIGIIVIANHPAVRQRLLGDPSACIVGKAHRLIQRIGHRFQITAAVVGEVHSACFGACALRRTGQASPVIIGKADGMESGYLGLQHSAQKIQRGAALPSQWRGVGDRAGGSIKGHAVSASINGQRIGLRR